MVEYQNANSALYSLLTVTRSNLITDKELEKIRENLNNGIKQIFILDAGHSVLSDRKGELKAFYDCYLLQVYIAEGDISRFIGVQLIDGHRCDRFIEDFIKLVPSFNGEQYRIEHASPESHLMIKAGAGTGKTTVMIQRIMYLLHTTPNLNLENISMITFTREAAHQMQKKLREQFQLRFTATRKPKYLHFIEQLPFMSIKTIHAFAKMILQEAGSQVGFGNNVQIKTFKMEKKKIIYRYLDENLLDPEDRRTLQQRFSSIKLYELVKIIENFWDELEKKSYRQEEIERINFGDANKDFQPLQNILKKIFSQIEKEIQDLKIRLNGVSLNDIPRQMDRIESLRQLTLPIKYLFVDEFQDTDNAQIRMVAKIVRQLYTRVFVVGDIKQSIYRFRGATDTAFEQLEYEFDNIKEEIHHLTLVRNYRTCTSVLDELDFPFSHLGGLDLLKYKEDDKLVGMLQNDFSFKVSVCEEKNQFSDEVKKRTLRWIESAQKSLPNLNDEKDHGSHFVTCIVRTNNQAKRLQNWCEEKGIFTELHLNGTFFLSQAVKEFAALVEALLYPGDARARLNLLNTSYSKVRIHWSRLAVFDGDSKQIMDFLNTPECLPFTQWDECLILLRKEPLLSVLRKIMLNSDYLDRYEIEVKNQLIKTWRLKLNQAERELQITIEADRQKRQYHTDLNQLFELIHQKFSSDFLTLYGLHQWLILQQATNREEDVKPVEDVSKSSQYKPIKITTVHRAKGLEFHTVILPFTARDHLPEFNRIIVGKREGQLIAGWQVKKNSKINNYFYEDLNNDDKKETLEEEARLLYVALTRCKQRLWIINNLYGAVDKTKLVRNNHTWASMLPYDEEVDMS